MRVYFDCLGCGVNNAPVDVPDRAEGEDIVSWMRKVQAAVGAVHREFSPGCTSPCDGELRIPTPDGTTQIGTPPTAGTGEGS